MTEYRRNRIPGGCYFFTVALANRKTDLLIQHMNVLRHAVRAAKHERGIWQRRFWEHTIRDDDDYRAHCGYVHFNPVKHGLVSHPAEWPYSSYHRPTTFNAHNT